MDRIVECVPNISEGRDIEKIERIVSVIEQGEGVKLLSYEPDADYNRTVITFVGTPEGVVEAGKRLLKAAYEEIDMRNHKGEHPRMGAVDVFPFVPVKGVTMDDCVALARKLGRWAGEELKIPVYYYEYAATTPERKNLATIRSGEYEGLQEKLKDPRWKPDEGPAEFVPTFGAVVIGARDFLIAYNVNIDSQDVKYSKTIAETIRESGVLIKSKGGKKIFGADGRPVRIPGRLKYVKAMGVTLDKYNITQVSMNLTNFHVTPPHIAFEAVKLEAEKLGVHVKGSEIVGLVPLEALVLAGRFYSLKEDREPPEDSDELLKIAIDELGLSVLEEFVPEKKVIEYMIE